MRADILVQYVGAYIFSLFVAHLVIRQILRWIRKQTYQDDKAKPLDFYLGITERAVATSLLSGRHHTLAPLSERGSLQN